MPTYTLTVIDTPGIQPYIFGSNRLRENIGASELVRCATTTWPLECLQAAGDTNVQAGELNHDLHIEDGKIAAEVIYVGGGNALILFREPERAVEFTTALSRRLVEEAPGLELAVAHTSIEWEHLTAGVADAMQALARAKHNRPPSAPLLGLSVTAACESTGLVATAPVKTKGTSYPASDAVRAKVQMVETAETRLRRIFSADFHRSGYHFPRDFEDFGQEGENYIAVVHADGNSMGQFFRQLAEQHRGQPRAYISAVRQASQAVEQASKLALNQVGGALLAPGLADRNKFRPLVFGGDDLTFVCDGRLGLTLAALYLEAFETATASIAVLGKRYACAGIAVVKTHYPFARAYSLCEMLAKNAKSYVAECKKQGEADFSALDWHFAATGLLGSLEEIRHREYRVPQGQLEMRPLRLREAGREWRTWPTFVRVVEKFGEQAQEQRNKVMRLREVLRAGAEAVRQFRGGFGVSLPQIDPAIKDFEETGWHSQRCGYFDAIEALDFYTSLAGGNDGNL